MLQSVFSVVIAMQNKLTIAVYIHNVFYQQTVLNILGYFCRENFHNVVIYVTKYCYTSVASRDSH